jgi:hypothetical protein
MESNRTFIRACPYYFDAIPLVRVDQNSAKRVVAIVSRLMAETPTKSQKGSNMFQNSRQVFCLERAVLKVQITIEQVGDFASGGPDKG